MNINLRKVVAGSDVDLFAKYKVALMKSHQKYANQLGLLDRVVDRYQEVDAIEYIGKDHFYQYIIQYDSQDVGIIEYQIDHSEIDDEKIIYINHLFVDSKYRNMGIGKEVLFMIKNQTDYRIELECWYGMPANKLYLNLGMEAIKTRYIWK